MVELAMVILIMTITISLALVIANTSVGRSQAADNVQQMALMEANIRRFIIANNRVPCPDTSNDGVENCDSPASSFGWFPYRSMGLSAQLTDSNGQPLLYGASPDLQNPVAVPLAPWDYPSGSLDRFCAALQGRIDEGFRSDELTVASADSSSCAAASGAFNPATAMVSGGLSDANGNGDFFDGLNTAAARNGAICIENPGRVVSARYDDQVRVIGHSELHGQMCMQGRDSFDAALWNGGGP